MATRRSDCRFIDTREYHKLCFQFSSVAKIELVCQFLSWEEQDIPAQDTTVILGSGKGH